MKKIKITLYCLLVLCGIYAAPQNARAQEVAKAAPEISFSACLNDPHLSQRFYKNKYLVLDFWATWCGPCVASFPHFDSLSRKFSSDNVVFAIITSEERNKVTKFLKNRNIKAYQLLDSITTTSKTNAKINSLYGITAQNFAVGGIPYSVIIDKNNQIVWTGNSAELNANTLNEVFKSNTKTVIEAQRISRSRMQSQAEKNAQIFAGIKKDTLQENNCSLYTANMPYVDGSMSAGTDKNKDVRFVEVGSRPFNFYYYYFTRTPFTRFEDKSGLKSIYMRVEGDTDMSNEDFYPSALEMMRKAYHLKFIKKQKLVDAFDLKIVDQLKFQSKSKTLAGSTPDDKSFDETEKQLVFSNSTMEEIGKGLEDYLNAPVFVADDKYLQALCDMAIEKGDIPHLNKFLADTYGLTLQATKHTIEFTEIVQDEK